MAQVLTRDNADQRVAFNGTWEQFRLIQQATQNAPGVKLSFFAAVRSRFSVPGFKHENFARNYWLPWSQLFC